VGTGRDRPPQFVQPVLLGEMCPQGAAGSPGLLPLAMRGAQWRDDVETLAALIERGAVARYTVFGHDGERVGAFDAVAHVDVGLPQPAATGVYVGVAPCTHAVGGGARSEDPACNVATRGCGLAIGEVDAAMPGREPRLRPGAIGGACLAGDDLAVDIDGDGAPERYRLGAFLDAGRFPAEQVSAEPAAAVTCTPRFSIHGLQLAPGFEPGAKVEAKYLVDLDVLGVVDLDGDARREVILAVRYPSSRTIVVFTARDQVGLLERTGETTAWP